MIKLCASVAILAAVIVLAFACSSSSSTVTVNGTATTSANESAYFTQLATIFAGGQTGSDAASTKLNNDLNAAQTLDDNRAAINTFLDSMVGVFSTAMTGMQALTPPGDARDAHNKFLQDVQNAKTKSSDLKGQLASASTTADFNTIVDAFNTEVDALVSDANNACLALQDLDNQHGANVDLSCNQ